MSCPHSAFRLLCEQPQWGRRARGAGRVSCKNIKPECPTLACGQPRQLPGHCCQTCPQGKAGFAERGGRQGRDAWLRGMERSTGPLLAHPKPVSPTPGAEHSSSEKQPTGLAFEYPRDPEHRSYSDRGEPGAEDRGRGDGHTGRQGPGRNWGCDRRRAAAADDELGTSSSPRRLRGAADRAKVASGGAGSSVAAALQSAVLHLLPAVRKRKEGGGVSPGPGRENLERLEQRFWPRLRAGAQGMLITRLDRPTRIRFSDSTGSILFEHPAAPTQDGLVR